MLKKIKKNIRHFRKAKYQRILFSKKDIILRKRGIKYICDFKTQDDYNKKYCRSCKFFSSNLKKENFISFYKKFNTHLALKANYNSITLKKKNNKDACLKSYFLFSEFLMMSKKVNNIQKLNTILKVNDLLILSFQKYKHINLIKLFKRNFLYERKLIKLYS